MIEHVYYYPILKWKKGEYSALYNLQPQIKDHICPIIEITPAGYDPESHENRTTVDAHIKDIGFRLHKSWDDRISFIDIENLKASKKEEPRYINKIFENCAASFCRAIPVVHLEDEIPSLDAYKEIIKNQKRGCMLRIKIGAITDTIEDKVNFILKKLDVNVSEIYLLADLDKLNIREEDEEAIYDILSERLCKIFNAFDWHTIIIAGSSFPEEITDGTLSNRYEWKLYKNFLDKFANPLKEPNFSDYYVLNPEHSFPTDGKIIKPKAKLRYTTDNGWYFNKTPSKSKRKKDIEEDKELKGGEQYKLLCRDLIACPFFRGSSFSKGDEYIYQQATASKANGGNATTWVKASTSQHITKVVTDLSKLLGFSLRCEQGLLGLLERTLE